MKPENRLKDIQIALKLADWFSTEEHVDYNADLSLGHLFVNGKIVFYDSTVLEFTESITPDGLRKNGTFVQNVHKIQLWNGFCLKNIGRQDLREIQDIYLYKKGF
jgi:hypothetical protein